MNNVGVDLHKVHTQVCIEDEKGAVLIERRVKTSREMFAELFRGQPPMRVLLESSGESEWAARCIESFGHEVIVADPSYLVMYGTRDRRVKTDARDARTLADACRLGAFRKAHRTTETHRQSRRRLRVRDALVRARAEIVTLVQALLRQDGFRVPTGGPGNFADRVMELGLPGRLLSEVAPLLAQIEPLNSQIAYCDRMIEGLCREDEFAARLETVPMVGPITALAFASVIDRPERFKDAHQVEAYLGLVPRELSSGEKQHRGSITKAGDRYVRTLLVQAAVRMARLRPPAAAPLWQWAARVEARRGKHVARIALARRIAGVLFAMMRDRASYLPQRLIREPVAA